MDRSYEIPGTGDVFGCVQKTTGKGAALELNMRLLACTVPALQKFARPKNLGNIEEEMPAHFSGKLSGAEKDMLRLCWPRPRSVFRFFCRLLFFM
jgi:hypothetical protein